MARDISFYYGEIKEKCFGLFLILRKNVDGATKVCKKDIVVMSKWYLRRKFLAPILKRFSILKNIDA